MRKILTGIALLTLATANGFADKGDSFLEVAVNPYLASFKGYSSLGLGGSAAYDFGINERTNFALGITANMFKAEREGVDNLLQTRAYFASYFTPYFGEIRPEVGFSFGILGLTEEETEVAMALGMPIRVLYAATDALQLFLEGEPLITFGDITEMEIGIRMGMKFRLGD